MDSGQVAKKAREIIRRYNTRDMYCIAKSLGIHVDFSDEFKNLLGMYFSRWRNRFIVLNNRLDEVWSNMVLAHEIGHDQLHRKLASKGLQEFELFSIKSRTEYEANAFAAHLLLDSDEVYSLLKEENDVYRVAQEMNCCVNLLSIKLSEMSAIGYDISYKEGVDSQFFKKIRV